MLFFLVRFELQGSVAEFATQDPDVTRRFNSERYPVSGDPANLNGDVVSDVDLLTNLAAEY